MCFLGKQVKGPQPGRRTHDNEARTKDLFSVSFKISRAFCELKLAEIFRESMQCCTLLHLVSSYLQLSWQHAAVSESPDFALHFDIKFIMFPYFKKFFIDA